MYPSKNYQFLSINAICHTFGGLKTQALPVFHALTGCNTTSAFRKKARHFCAPFSVPCLKFECQLQSNERFIVVLCKRISLLSFVNDAWSCYVKEIDQ